MLPTQVAQRLEEVGVSPALRSSLHALIAHDDITSRRNWGHIIPSVSAALGATDPLLVQPFALAWGTLNAALRHLDHVQDGDIIDTSLLTSVPIAAQYNVLLTYYLLATTFLDDLDGSAIPPTRLLRLRRLWSDCLLLVASGQQADLEQRHDTLRGLEALERYQQLVQAKTGALFALAFGGTAMLLTDDQSTIEILYDAGTVYGMLVQFGDDIGDAQSQCNPALTLPRAYRMNQASHSELLPDVDAFWHVIYTDHVHQVKHALAALPAPMQTQINQLFTTVFEQRQHHEAI